MEETDCKLASCAILWAARTAAAAAVLADGVGAGVEGTGGVFQGTGAGAAGAGAVGGAALYCVRDGDWAVGAV